MKLNKLFSVFVILGTVIALASTLRGDALITTPPGTPNDWAALTMPFPLDVDESYTREPRKEKTDPEYGKEGSYVVPLEVVVERSIIFNIPPYDGNEAWMTDVGLECPWIDPEHAMELELWKLKKSFTFRLRSFLLRFFIAPGEIPAQETIDQFIMMGIPGWIEASWTKKCLDNKGLLDPFGTTTDNKEIERMREIVDAIIASTGPGSMVVDPVEGKNYYEKQMYKILLEDLSSGYLLDIKDEFARRTRSLGREIVPMMVNLVETHENRLVRRNAMGFLTTVANPETSLLMRKLVDDVDPVVAYRAMMYLARERDEEAQAWFLNRAKDKIKPYNSFVFYALGRIGKAESIPLIEERIDEILKVKANLRTIKQNEDLWTLMSALVRCSLYSGTDSKMFFKVASEVRPGEDYRYRTVVDMAGLGLTLNNYKGKWPSGLDFYKHKADKPDQFFTALTTEPAENPPYRFSPRAHYLLMEVIMNRPDLYGDEVLRRCLDHAYCDNTIKYWLLRYHKFEASKENVKFLEEIATDTKMIPTGSQSMRPRFNALIRASALYAMYRFDREAATRVAGDVLKEYAKTAGSFNLITVEAGYEAITAMAILRVERKLKEYQKEVRQLVEGKDKVEPAFSLDGQGAYVGAFLPAPVTREAIRELGRLKDPADVKALISVFDDKDNPFKGDAALALGRIGGREALNVLLNKIDHMDSWVRFCCNRSLEDLTGHEIEVDFIYGSRDDISKGIKEWREYVKREIFDKE